jgi:hypothetical protein
MITSVNGFNNVGNQCLNRLFRKAEKRDLQSRLLDYLKKLCFFNLLLFSLSPRLRRILDEIAVPVQLFSVKEDKSPITFPACWIGEPLSPGCGISNEGKLK